MTSENQQRILKTLKQHGSMTAQQVGESLGMTSMGARQLLLPLRDKQLIIDFDKAEKVGRPSKFWKLTENGHRSFPDRHNDLTVEIIHSVKHVFGEEGLEKLIKDREKNMLKNYKTRMSNFDTLKDKLKCLALIRTEEGYMAKVKRQGDVYLLIENHCPICTAAKSCQNFCRSELQIFKKCLGPNFNITREEHILEKSARCVYRVSEQGPSTISNRHK